MVLFLLTLLIPSIYGEDYSFVNEVTMGAKEADSDYIASAETPFKSCKLDKTLAGQPRTTYFDLRVPKRDKEGNRTKDFFKVLSSKIVNEAKENLNLLDNMILCYNIQSAKKESCAELIKWGAEDFPAIVKDARYYLARANFYKNALSPQVSSKLDPLGSYKYNQWDNLTAGEINYVSSSLKASQHKFVNKKGISIEKLHQDLHSVSYLQSKFKNNPNPLLNKEQTETLRTFSEYRDSMKDVLQKDFASYRKLLITNPILAFVKTPEPHLLDIRMAAENMRGFSEKELASLLKYKKNIEESSGDEVSASSLKLLEYSAVVEEVLSEHPEYCGVATAAAKFQKNKNQVQTAVSLPLLAVSLYFPASRLVQGGLLAGAALSTYLSRKQAKEDHQAAYSRATDDSLRGRTNPIQAKDVSDDYSTGVKILYTAVGVSATGRVIKSLRAPMKYYTNLIK